MEDRRISCELEEGGQWGGAPGVGAVSEREGDERGFAHRDVLYYVRKKKGRKKEEKSLPTSGVSR